MATATEILTAQPSNPGAAPLQTGATPVPVAPAAPASGWWDSVSNPEVKGWLANKKYESPEVLASSAWSLEKMVGADKAGRTAILPKDEKDAEGWKAFNKAIGVPEKPEDYKLPLPTGDDGTFAKTAAQWFHQAGVPAKAAETIAKNWNDFIGKQVTDGEAAEKAASEQKLQDLKVQWGPKFDENAELARRGLASVGKEAGLDDADLKKLEVSLGTDKMLKMFHRLGAAGSESNFAGADKNGGFSIAPEKAQTRLNEIYAERAAGKISDMRWKDEIEPEITKLMKVMTGEARAS